VLKEKRPDGSVFCFHLVFLVWYGAMNAGVDRLLDINQDSSAFATGAMVGVKLRYSMLLKYNANPPSNRNEPAFVISIGKVASYPDSI
jgi:hypothetical protein